MKKQTARVPTAAPRAALTVPLFVAVTAANALAGLPLPRLGHAFALPIHERVRGWMGAAARKQSLLYVTNGFYTINIYDPNDTSNPLPVGVIAMGLSAPGALAADRRGTLYVPNVGNDTVTEYPSGHIAPAVTLTSGLSYPSNVAVAPDGRLAVANEGPQNTTVVEFERGASTPSVTITCTSYPVGLAYDHYGNLYIGDVRYPKATKVFVVAPGSKKCADTGIDGVGFSGGMAIDRSGNLWIADQAPSPYKTAVWAFAPGSTQPLPISVQPRYGDFVGIAFDRKQHLFAADFLFGDVLGFPYGQGSPYATWSNGLDASPVGVALAPALQP